MEEELTLSTYVAELKEFKAIEEEINENEEPVATEEPVASTKEESVATEEPVASTKEEPVATEVASTKEEVATEEPVASTTTEEVIAESVATEEPVASTTTEEPLTEIPIKEEITDLDIITDVTNAIKLNFHTPTDVVKIVASGIKHIQKYSQLSGQQKKQLVIKAVHDIIKSSDLSLAEQQKLLSLLDIIADPVVDALVDFGKDTVMFIKSKLAVLIQFIKSKLSCCPISPQVIDELTSLMEAQFCEPYNETKVILLLSNAVKFMTDKKLTGLEKKSITLSAIRAVIRTSENISDQEGIKLLEIVDTVGSEFINSAVNLGQDMNTFKICN